MDRNVRRCAPWAVALALVCAWPHACHAQYLWQVSGAHSQREDGTSFEIGSTRVAASYYFRPVDVRRGPYSLAPFLDRSSHVTAELRRDKSRAYSSITGERIFIDSTDGYGLSGRRVWRGSGWYVGGRAERAEADRPASSLAEEDFRTVAYGLSAGKYVAEATTVELTLESIEARMRNRLLTECPVFPLACPPDSTARTEGIGLSLLHVGDLRHMSYAVSASARSRRLEVRYRDAAPPPPDAFRPEPPPVPSGIYFAPPGLPLNTVDQSRVYSAAGELFPGDRLGVKLGYMRSRGDLNQERAVDVSASWFFTPNVAAQIGWSRTRMNIPVPSLRDVDIASVRLIGRF